jgi:hypothetical protein
MVSKFYYLLGMSMYIVLLVFITIAFKINTS